MINEEIENDLKRAKDALKSAERNFEEEDIYAAANRIFVACENSIYALLKHKFGSSSISRQRVLTRLKEINPGAKEIYNKAYDLRVQSDYGRVSQIIPLNKENINKILNKVKTLINEVEQEIKREKSNVLKRGKEWLSKS
jgi:uncharacterized protein (UPF0332 family)